MRCRILYRYSIVGAVSRATPSRPQCYTDLSTDMQERLILHFATVSLDRIRGVVYGPPLWQHAIYIPRLVSTLPSGVEPDSLVLGQDAGSTSLTAYVGGLTVIHVVCWSTLHRHSLGLFQAQGGRPPLLVAALYVRTSIGALHPFHCLIRELNISIH